VPAPAADDTRKSLEERTTEPDGEIIDEILEGARRDRPPPARPKRAAPETHGEESAAYYAGPKAVGAAADTPDPEPAVQVAATDPGVRLAKRSAATVELPFVAERKAERRAYAMWLVAAVIGGTVIAGAWWAGKEAGTTSHATSSSTTTSNGTTTKNEIETTTARASHTAPSTPNANPTPAANPTATAPATATAAAIATTRATGTSTAITTRPVPIATTAVGNTAARATPQAPAGSASAHKRDVSSTF
jgi:hypothetical protein